MSPLPRSGVGQPVFECDLLPLISGVESGCNSTLRSPTDLASSAFKSTPRSSAFSGVTFTPATVLVSAASGVKCACPATTSPRQPAALMLVCKNCGAPSSG